MAYCFKSRSPRQKNAFCLCYKPLKHDIELTQRTAYNEISEDLDKFNVYTFLSFQLCRRNNHTIAYLVFTSFSRENLIVPHPKSDATGKIHVYN